MDILSGSDSLHGYLTRLRCPRENRPDTGSACWESEGDLFGASHRIDLSWTPTRIEITRHTHLPGEEHGQEAWLLSLSRPAADDAIRWRLETARGGLLTPDAGSGESMTIAHAIKAIRGQILGLGQGAQPGWSKPRTPRP